MRIRFIACLALCLTAALAVIALGTPAQAAPPQAAPPQAALSQSTLSQSALSQTEPVRAVGARPDIVIPPEGALNVIIQNRYSSKCLELPYSTTAPLAMIGQFSCHGLPNQRWNFTPSNGFLQNVNSGQCLSILGAHNIANGVVARQYPCVSPDGSGGINQRWVLWGDGSFFNIMTGKCLDLLGFDRDDFALIGQWDCTGAANQQWGMF